MNVYRNSTWIGLPTWATALALALVMGCLNTPYDGQEIPSKSSEIVVTGAFTIPGRGVRIEAWDFDTHSWYLEDLFVLDDNIPLDNWGYPVDWYGFYKTTRLNNSKYWLPRVNTAGGVSSSAARARLRVTVDGHGPLVVLPQGYASCTTAYPDLNTAVANCGDYGSQLFANLETPGYTEALYVPRPVVVARHSSVSLSADDADALIHGVETILQREDPDTSGNRSSDYACNVRFPRQGSVRVIGDCNPVIDSWQDQECYFSKDYGERTVILVPSISYCAPPFGTPDQEPPAIYGCADPVRDVVVVEAGLPGVARPIVTAHELGHTVGLDHITSNEDPRNLMGNDAQNGRRLTYEDCRDFRQEP